MFSSKPKFTPGVPYEVQRIYDMLSPKPKELLHNASSRRFIAEGEVGVFNHKERRTKKRFLFLFNDILLITKQEGKKSFWLKIFVSLKSANLRVEDVPDSATRYKVEFRIYAPKKTIILFTSTEEQKHKWIKEIRACYENPGAVSSNTFDPNTSAPSPSSTPAPAPAPAQVSAPPPTQEKEETIKISGDIGKIEIPGMDDGSYGNIPEDEDSSEEDASAPVFFTQTEAAAPTAINKELHVNQQDFTPLPPTPNSTPVQGSILDDFDSLANRNTGTVVPQSNFDPNAAFNAFANSQPLQPQPFGSSTPLTPTPVAPSSGSILQPIPANSTPSMNMPSQPLQPTTASRMDGFAALKSLDGQQNGNQPQQNLGQGGFLPQIQPQQMFQQNLSVEEQMQRLAMQSPYYNGN